MSPFEPVGDRARWREVYDLLKVVPVNGVLTYDEMAKALALDPVEDRHVIQVAMRRAANEFLMCDDHAVEAVPNKGYRVVEAPEHMYLARNQQRRSSKALVRSHKTITHVDVTALDDNTRKAFEMVAMALGAQMNFSRRLDIRQSHLEKVMTEIKKGHQAANERTAEELAEMRERLAALEAKQE